VLSRERRALRLRMCRLWLVRLLAKDWYATTEGGSGAPQT